MSTSTASQKVMLVILDGFGNAKDSAYNAVRNAKMPYYHKILSENPSTELLTHGLAVGLPEGIMGNSEVGHMTLGAGRIIYQDLTRINLAIKQGDFQKNAIIRDTFEKGRNSRVHLMGLLSDGGVHSHITHVHALLDLCAEMKIPNVSVHTILDGRDTTPQSGIDYMKNLLEHPTFSAQGKNGTHAVVASISGRFFAMDRDKRWDRVQKAYATITGQTEETRKSPMETIEASYAAGKTDEFFEPVLLNKKASIQSGDSMFFFNYRSDRAREISEALTAEKFDAFNRGNNAPKLAAYAGMTVYSSAFTFPAAYPPQNQDNILGLWLEKQNKTQFRTAETEKYAHITFFFNGGRELPFKGEDRAMVNSPKEVATYDLKPEMSAVAVATGAEENIRTGKYDFILINFANADMVGHTGFYDAAVRALETVDSCLAKIIPAAIDQGYHILVTADHGNAEEMRDSEGNPHTQHTLNPVPLIWIASKKDTLKGTLKNGSLSDVMPTVCELMHIETPIEATGVSLIVKKQ